MAAMAPAMTPALAAGAACPADPMLMQSGRLPMVPRAIAVSAGQAPALSGRPGPAYQRTSENPGYDAEHRQRLRRMEAIHENDLAGLVQRLPADPGERVAFVRKQGLFSIALGAGSLKIVRAMLQWDPTLPQDKSVQFFLGKGTLEGLARNWGEGLSPPPPEDRVEVIRMMLEWGANVEGTGEMGGPLFWLARSKFPEGSGAAAELLLRRGARIESRTGNLENAPLIEAAAKGNGEVVAAIRKHRTIPPQQETELARLQLLRGEPPPGSAQALINALPDPEALKRLLDAGADVNVRDGYGRTALAVAQDDQEASIRLLVSRGATVYPSPVNDKPVGPVTWVMLGGYQVAALALLQRDGIGADDCAVPYYAAQVGATRLLAALLDRGVRMNQTMDARNRTPFFIAIANGRVDAVKLLLDRRAASANDKSPSHREWQRPTGHFAALNLPELREIGGEGALALAVYSRQPKVARLLLERGANAKAQDVPLPPGDDAESVELRKLIEQFRAPKPGN